MNTAKLIGMLTDVLDQVKNIRRWLPYFSAIFLGLALSQLTHTLTLYAANQYMPLSSPVVTAKARNAAINKSANVSNPTEIVGGPLMKAPPENLMATPGQEEAPVEVAVPFTLIGTLEGDPSFARAILDVRGPEPGRSEFKLWTKIGNVKLVKIGREHIIIKEGENRIKIAVGESTDQAKENYLKKQQEQAAAKASSGSGDSKVNKVLSRDEVNKMIMGNPAEIYKGASFGPFLENNKITGYKIHRITPDHIFYKLGARAKDIVRKVNGYELSDTERMFELWKSMKTAPQVTIEIERDNSLITYDFYIRN